MTEMIYKQIENEILALNNNKKFINIVKKYTWIGGSSSYDKKYEDVLQAIYLHLLNKLNNRDELFINKFINDTTGLYIIKLAVLILKSITISKHTGYIGRQLFDTHIISYDNLTGDFTSEDLINASDIHDMDIDKITTDYVSEFNNISDQFLDTIVDKLQHDSQYHPVAKVMYITILNPKLKFRYLCETMFANGELQANRILMYTMQQEYYEYIKNWIKRGSPLNENPTNNKYLRLDVRMSKVKTNGGQHNLRKEKLKVEIAEFIKNNRDMSIPDVAKLFDVHKSFIYNKKLHK